MHTKTKANSELHKQWEVHKTVNEQQHNHHLRMDRGLSYWRQIFDLDSVVVNSQILFSSYGILGKSKHMRP